MAISPSFDFSFILIICPLVLLILCTGIKPRAQTCQGSIPPLLSVPSCTILAVAADTVLHCEDSASLTSHRLLLSVSGFLPVMDLFLDSLFSLPIVIVKLISHPWLLMSISSGETRLIACEFFSWWLCASHAVVWTRFNTKILLWKGFGGPWVDKCVSPAAFCFETCDRWWLSDKIPQELYFLSRQSKLPLSYSGPYHPKVPAEG